MNSTTLNQLVLNHNSIEGWLTINEGKKLYHLALSKNGQTIVEIGSWHGKSTLYLAAACKENKSGQVFAVDPHLGSWSAEDHKKPTYKSFINNLRKANVSTYVKSLITTSQKAVETWKSPIDLLFIDGLHDYKNSSFDFLHWTKHLKDGGYVILHDAFCGQEGPMRVAQGLLFPDISFSNIKVSGSMIYALKNANRNTRLLIDMLRIKLIRLSHHIYNSHLPNILKIIIIHKILKIFLI